MNNRYLKATLLPDGVRVSYTLIFGELPGAAERRRIDADGDGRLAPEETRRFGERLAAELTPRLSVAVDGVAHGGWKLVDVGVGQPIVAGGPFALDLELVAPYPDPWAAEHVVELEDLTAVPLPGEVELRIDESPGVRVLASHLAHQRGGIELLYSFKGNSPARGERAVRVRLGVDEEARPARPASRVPLVAAGVAVAAAALLLVLRRRRAT